MSSSYQHISVSTEQDVLVLTIVADQVRDFKLAEAMGSELIDAVQKAGSRRVVVDMGNVAFVSSVGYGPLVSLRSRLRADGGRLVLCNLSEIVKETFEATRLLINPRSPKSLFEHTDTRESAVAMLVGNVSG